MSKRKKKKKRGGRRSLCLSLLHTARTLHKLAQEGLQEEDVAAIVPAPGQGEVGRRHGGPRGPAARRGGEWSVGGSLHSFHTSPL